MNRITKEHLILIIGLILTLLLLSIFVGLQYYDSSMLNIDNRWLLISGVPTLIALIAGGYIKKFKGFGIELDARTKGPVTAKKTKAPFETKSGSELEIKDIEIESQQKSLEPIPQRLLSLIWNYPLAGGNQVSWAVKESLVLMGDLEQASQKPGLGIAILSTELAIKAFGDHAKSRIDSCINWALSRTQHQHPFLVLIETNDPVTSRTQMKTDFRHTLALSIILARSQQHINHLKHYVQLTLEKQKDDGGWPPGERTTDSEVFTVLYAIELLTLCHDNTEISKKTQEKATIAKDKAVDWLINNIEESGLWKSGVSSFSWDPLYTTAWILRRLIPLANMSNKYWNHCVNQSLLAMIRAAQEDNVWLTSDEMLRFRVEARILSAVITNMEAYVLDPIVSERTESYINDTRQRFEKSLSDISDEQLDLSTSLSLVDSMIRPTELKDWAKKCCLK